MANQLKMADIQAILSLDAQGWSHRSIAARLGVHRETVSRYVRLAAGGSKPATLHAGIWPENEPTGGSKPATVTRPPPQSMRQASVAGLPIPGPRPLCLAVTDLQMPGRLRQPPTPILNPAQGRAPSQLLGTHTPCLHRSLLAEAASMGTFLMNAYGDISNGA